MTDSRSFLARWSERKRAEARAERAPEPPRDVATEALSAPDAPMPQGAPDDQGAPLDLDALPSIEDITGDTDIGAFLRRNVPGDLRNAALRRAWTSDPTISRFIEMADYDWDFNAPGGNQVFGPLSSAVDAARMAAEILNPPPRALPEPVDPVAPTQGLEGSSQDPEPPGPYDVPIVPNVVSTTEDDCPLTSEENAPGQLSDDASSPVAFVRNSPELLELDVGRPSVSTSELESSHPQRRRRHGGALPDLK